jgi:protein SCO1
MNKTLLVLGAAALSLVLGISLWLWQQSRLADASQATAQAATVLPQPRAVPDFSLTDHNGAAFGNAQLKDHWSLLFFGFTRCPDICPNTLGLLQAVNAAMKTEASSAGFQVVFVSVDPKFDTTPVLKSYVEYFDPSFVAVSGPEQQLRLLTDSLYVPYSYVPMRNTDDYTVEHSGALVLLNPDGQAVAYFSPPLQARPIIDDLRRLSRS